MRIVGVKHINRTSVSVSLVGPNGQRIKRTTEENSSNVGVQTA